MKKLISTVLVIMAVTFGLTACSDGSGNTPENLTGDWTWTKDGINFEAMVTETEIEIYLTLDETRGLYWRGTFETSLAPDSTYTSKGDLEALEASLYGSLDSTKEFTYEDGRLVYEFGIMGTSTEVWLEKVG